MNMLEQARKTAEKYNMLKNVDRVYAGVSGGADSVALLYFLISIKDEFGFEIKAMHLNHQLRETESNRDETFVKTLCKGLGVECVTETADIKAMAKEEGLSIEESGRKARYEFFSRYSRIDEPEKTKIAVAHTLNDSVETMLLNFARGTALRGICGIPPVRGDIIRPLIECGRGLIEEYLRGNGFEHIHDSSNDSDDFARNRLRHHAIPVLSEVNASFLKNAPRIFEALRADADYLDAEAARALCDIESKDGRFERAAYLALAPPIRLRVLLILLSRHNIATDSARLSRLDSIIVSGDGAEQLSVSLYLEADGEFFELTSPDPEAPPFFETVLIPVEESIIEVFPDKKLRVINTDYENYEENIKYSPKALKNSLNCDRIDGILVLRQKMPGDKIKLKGRGCTKTFKKLFQEAEIRPAGRGRLFVIADDSGPVWVEGFGAAERASADKTARRVLIVDVITEEEE